MDTNQAIRKHKVWCALNESFGLSNVEPPKDWCEVFTTSDGTLTGWHHSEEMKHSISEGVKLAYAEGRLVPHHIGCKRPKSDEHKESIRQGMKRAHAEGRRKPPIPKRFTDEELKERIREQQRIASRNYRRRKRDERQHQET